MSIAIVTGASTGMGEEFCRRLDSMDLDCIWMVSRSKDRMEAIASGMKTPVRIFAVDLTDRQQIGSLFSIINEEKPDIGFLVNNAGFAKFGNTWEVPIEHTRNMIDLNVTALVTLTSVCIPYMKRDSHIIELCSLSAYIIGLERLNVYGSTKAFVRHFCSGLRKELAPMGISVTEVSPGWVDTAFIPSSQSEIVVPKRAVSPTVNKEKVVSCAIDAALKGKKKTHAGFTNSASAWIGSHIESIGSVVWTKRIE